MKKKVSLLLVSICMMIGMAMRPNMILARGGGYCKSVLRN